MSMLKGFQTGGEIYFGALHLVNGAFNLVATDILVRCTFAKLNTQFIEVGKRQGAAPRNLGKTNVNRVLIRCSAP